LCILKIIVADPDSNPDPDPSDLYVFGLLDSDPDPFVRGMEPDPDLDPKILPSPIKNNKKNLDFYFL
jgi:hypothetical protein